MFFCGERENVDEESLVWFDFVYLLLLEGFTVVSWKGKGNTFAFWVVCFSFFFFN